MSFFTADSHLWLFQIYLWCLVYGRGIEILISGFNPADKIKLGIISPNICQQKSKIFEKPSPSKKVKCSLLYRTGIEIIYTFSDSKKLGPDGSPCQALFPTFFCFRKEQRWNKCTIQFPTKRVTLNGSGQIMIFHQPRLPWNKGISLP